MNPHMTDLYAYILDHGHAKPGDLEDHFCGRQPLEQCMFDPLGAWFRSPYAAAMTMLVYCGFVNWWRDAEDEVIYTVTRPMRYE